MSETDLRDQLRRYAAVMEEHSEARPAPSPRRSRRPSALALASVAAAALLVLAAAVVRTSPGGQQVASGSRSGAAGAAADVDAALLASLPRLHLPEPPDELRLTGVDTLPRGGERPGSDLDFQLFGTPGAADPFARGDLGLFVHDVEDGRDELPQGEDVPLGDLPARLDADDSSYGGTTLTWIEDDRVVRLVSRTLGTDALVAAGRGGIDTTGQRVRLVEPPPGLELVADGRQAYSALLGFIVPLASTGYVVDYDAVSSPPDGVSVFSVSDDGDMLDLIRWRDRDWLRATVVRGHEAVLVDRREGGDQQLVAWMEEDGTLGMLSATGMTGDELLPLAEQLRPATDQEWDALVAPDEGARYRGADPPAEEGEHSTTTTTTAVDDQVYGAGGHITDVRLARRGDTDRLVVEFADSVPEHDVRYLELGPSVGECTAPASDSAEHLFVILRATTFDDPGTPGFDVPAPLRTDTRYAEELVVGCDFELNVQLVLGVSSAVPFRVQELDNPPRLVVDLG